MGMFCTSTCLADILILELLFFLPDYPFSTLFFALRSTKPSLFFNPNTWHRKSCMYVPWVLARSESTVLSSWCCFSLGVKMSGCCCRDLILTQKITKKPATTVDIFLCSEDGDDWVAAGFHQRLITPYTIKAGLTLAKSNKTSIHFIHFKMGSK